jgi:mRNA interferase RelE/StbE
MSKSRRRIRLSDDAASLVRSLHPELKRKMKAALQAILDNPDSGKALKHELSGLHSFRISRFRIIYKKAGGGTIEIVVIGPRRTIYEETFRLVNEKKK